MDRGEKFLKCKPRFSIPRGTAVLLTLVSYGLYVSYVIRLSRGSAYYNDYGPLVPEDFPWFLASLSLLAFAFLVTCYSVGYSRWLFFSQWLLLVVGLFLTPYLITGTPRFRIAYLSYGYVEFVIRNSHLAPEEIWYHSWPGFAAFFAILIKVLGLVSAESILALFPFASMLAYGVFLWPVLRGAYSTENQQWCGLWVAALANWTDQAYFSPQGLGYFYFLLLLLLWLRRHEGKHPLVIVGFSSLVVTHLLTMLAAMLTFLFSRFALRKQHIALSLCMLALGASWHVFGLRGLVLSDVPGIVRQNIAFEAFQRYLLMGRFIATSSSRQLVVLTRTAFSLILVLLATLGWIVKMRRGRSSEDRFFLAILLAVGLLVLALPYGGEILTRVFLFSLVPIAYFASWFVERRRLVLAALPLWPILILLHTIAHYGGDSYDVVRISEIRVSEFLAGHAQSGELVALPPPLFAVKQEIFTQNNPFQPPEIYLSRGRSSSYNPVYLERASSIKRPRYVVLGPALIAMYSYSVGAPDMISSIQVWIRTSDLYGLLYNNGESVLLASL